MAVSMGVWRVDASLERMWDSPVESVAVNIKRRWKGNQTSNGRRESMANERTNERTGVVDAFKHFSISWVLGKYTLLWSLIEVFIVFLFFRLFNRFKYCLFYLVSSFICFFHVFALFMVLFIFFIVYVIVFVELFKYFIIYVIVS